MSNVVGSSDSIDRLPSLAEKLFALFDTQPAWIRAAVIASLATDIQPQTRVQRDRALERSVASITSYLGRKESRRVFAVIRYLTSSHAWLILKERFGLDGEEAGKAVAWALRSLIEDLKRRNLAARNQARTMRMQSGGR